MNSKIQGLLLILTTVLLWSFNGNIGDWLFSARNFTPEFLVVMRLIGSGTFLFIYNQIKYGNKSLEILKVKSNYPYLLLYSISGVMLMQYSYFKAIFYSNAPTAILIEDIGIFFVIGYLSFKSRKLPSKFVFIALIASIIGVFLLVTGGDINNLEANKKGLLWGIAAAIGLAFFNVSALPLQAHYPTTQIIGPSMILAGIILALLVKPSTINIYWDLYAVLGLLFCIILGTFIPFVLYMEGQKRAGADLAGIFSLAEPIFSTLIAVFIYGLVFKPVDYLGMGLIFGSICMLTLKEDVNA